MCHAHTHVIRTTHHPSTAAVILPLHWRSASSFGRCLRQWARRSTIPPSWYANLATRASGTNGQPSWDTLGQPPGLLLAQHLPPPPSSCHPVPSQGPVPRQHPVHSVTSIHLPWGSSCSAIVASSVPCERCSTLWPLLHWKLTESPHR